MQFQSIIAVLSLALAATALPSPNPTGSTSLSACNASGGTTRCCTSEATGGLLGLGSLLGLECGIPIINILNPTCQSAQQLNCCSNKSSGSINVLSNDCTNIQV